MSFDIRWDNETIKELRKLHSSVAKRIVQKVKQLDQDPFQSDVKKLKGQELYRLRVGDYRILFSLNKNILEVVKIGHRKNIYK